MRIEKLKLKNFRCFEDLEINFPESNLAVFIGLNGSGKTAILDAITLFLSEWRTFYFKNLKTQVVNREISPSISNSDISNGSQETINRILANHCNKKVLWRLDKNFELDSKIEFNENCNKGCEKPAFFISYKTTRKNDYNINSYCNNNFSDFERWFEKEENIENRLKLKKKDFNFTNDKLDVVREVITLFFTNISGVLFSNLRVEQIATTYNGDFSYNEELKYDGHYNGLVITCNEQDLKLFQLSDGQKILLNVVANIVFNLTRVNQENDNEDYVNNILQSEGIVLIDEIDLHLHPKWQQEVLPALQKTFTNIQFIVTTHSPQVLSNLKKEEVFILEDNKIVKNTPNVEGRDSNSILYELYGVEERPEKYKKKLNEFYSALDDDEIEKAKNILSALTEIFGEEDIEIVKANLHLDFSTEE